MNTTARTVAVLACAGVLSAGCAGQGSVDAGPSAASDTLEGTVRQVGNTPFVRTVVRGPDTAVTVVGELAEELSRASGARVRVWGGPAEGDGPPGPRMEVSGYEILSVDGARPTVGLLRHASGRGYYLETGEGRDVALAGVPDRLGTRVGAKVWVVLGEGGAVQRYGILKKEP